MIQLDYATVYRQNREAEREDSEWLDEVRRWQAEHRCVLAWLTAVESAWREAESILNAHAEAIRAHEARLKEHEQAVGQHWWGRNQFVDQRLAEEHQELEARHAEAKKAHDEIRQRHQAVLFEVRELLRTTLCGAVVPEWTSSPDDAEP